MDILSIIDKKKNKQTLTRQEIDYFIDGFVKTKTIKDYQASALLMAIFINGLNKDETLNLTKAMLNSGKTIDLAKVRGVKIDKHSTGGVGDKVSLILLPICAALGLKVAKMSGKGLGHTGGTIDKLESVDFKYNLQPNDYIRLLNQVGLCISAQTQDIVPADKMLYNLRNATATVASQSMIAASIVAKKLALKTNYVFLDVKVGDGGFNKDIKAAVILSQLMLDLFKAFKRCAVVHITNMTQPLGRAIGNGIELKAAIDFLNNKAESQCVKNLIYTFVADILITTKFAKNKVIAYKMIDQVIKSKAALNKFNEWMSAQNADLNLLRSGKYFNPKYQHHICAKKTGYLEYLSTKEIGLVAFHLGAGRITKESGIDHHAGIYLNAITNEYVKRGQTIATLYSSRPIKSDTIQGFINNYKINSKPINLRPIVSKIMKN